MRRFDFLHDGRPDAVVRVQTFRVPRRLRSAAASAAAAVLIVAAACGLEGLRVHAAAAEEARQQQRFERSAQRLAAARLQWQDVQRLVAADRRLGALRASGTAIAARLAGLGNLVPRGAWLEEIAPASDGWAVRGSALDLNALDATLANLVRDATFGRTRLVRVVRKARVAASPIVSFELHVEPSR